MEKIQEYNKVELFLNTWREDGQVTEYEVVDDIKYKMDEALKTLTLSVRR